MFAKRVQRIAFGVTSPKPPVQQGFACTSVRSAFTIVELLVCIGILSLMMALLLPSVQAMRESARFTQCSNNLKQVGLALQSYHAVHSFLPPASIWLPPSEPIGGGFTVIGVLDRIANGLAPASEPSRLHGNWALMLLPFLEQQELWERYHSNLPVSDAINSGVRETALQILRCPSDPQSGSMYERASLVSGESNLYARGNYAINAGPNKSCIDGLPLYLLGGEPCDEGYVARNGTLLGSGIGGVNAALKFRDFQTVGLSHMVAIDEIRAGLNPIDPRGSWALGFAGASITAGHGKYDKADRPNSSYITSDKIIGCTKLTESYGAENLKRLGMPCGSVFVLGYALSVQAGARSLHPTGVHVLSLDGSVHTIENSVDPIVWHSMHSRYREDTNESSF